MIVETRQPIPAKPDVRPRHDYEYRAMRGPFVHDVRASGGWRHVKVTDRRNRHRLSHAPGFVRYALFPTPRVVLGPYNLSTPQARLALYEPFRRPRCRGRSSSNASNALIRPSTRWAPTCGRIRIGVSSQPSV